jgi:adenylate cyclase
MPGDFQIAAWLVQPSLNAVSLRGHTVRLEPKVMQVLVHLADHAGEVIEKDHLLRAVWPDVFVSDDVLTRAISSLRRVFCDDVKSSRIIQTIPKRGYRLASPILPVIRGTRRFDSLVVLPYVNGDGDPETDYLSDGITECLINTLAAFPRLKVVARTTAFRYKGTHADPSAVARDLGVSAAITGRVAVRGGCVTIQADLVNAATGSQVWGQQFVRKCEDLVALQSDMAREISEQLRLQLTGEAQKLQRSHQTTDSSAYHLYLKALSLWHAGTEESVQRSIEVFEQAIRVDAGYAQAYAGLSECHSFLCCQLDYGSVSPRQSMPKAERAARKALELDSTLGAAHSSLASVYKNFHWDWRGAEHEFQQAITLSPNYPKAHQSYADLLTLEGRLDEAIVQIDLAHQLDPFSTTINTDWAFIFYLARDYDRAIRQLRMTLDLCPDYIPARSLLSYVLDLQGFPEEAACEYDRARELAVDQNVPMAVLGRVLSAGRHEQLRSGLELLQKLSEHRYVPAVWFCALYTRLNDRDRAFAWMQLALEERSNLLIYLQVDPLFDSLRGDPRFKEFVNRVGLEWPGRPSGKPLAQSVPGPPRNRQA